MASPVTEIPAAEAAAALEHFRRKLAFETDCWDVHESLRRGHTDFVVLDVRGRAAYARAHVPGAVSLPHRDISERRLAAWGPETVFVTYCAGPHCNGADRGALAIAALGRPVKIMIGGVTGWADEGLPFASGAEPGQVTPSHP